MSPPCVVVLGGEAAPERMRPPRLGRLAGRATVRHADDSSLAGLLPAADVLLVWDFTSDAVRRAWPGAGPRPGWVHTASAGVDRLLFPELVHSPTLVTNARGVFDIPIAEYVAGLIIAMAREFPVSWDLQRRRVWRHRETRTVAGSRAVVVGSGGIGRETARTLRALRVTVDLVGRQERTADPEFGRVHPAGALPGLLPLADWVVCAAPLTPATRGMFDAAAFALMKEGARFVNVGRGAHVVETDLIAALRSGRLAGAALDVFAEEPLPAGSPLWELPGVLLSPHMSGDTPGWEQTLADQFLDNFDRWVAGEPLHQVVDKQLGYAAASGTEPGAGAGAGAATGDAGEEHTEDLPA